MESRISLITLGVADVARSRAFYEALGWRASSASTAEVAFFQANGLALALWGRAALAADAEVDALFTDAVKAGAQAVKIPRKTFWGGYVGYFADPDWHLWEIAHNPFFALDEAGNLALPP